MTLRELWRSRIEVEDEESWMTNLGPEHKANVPPIQWTMESITYNEGWRLLPGYLAGDGVLPHLDIDIMSPIARVESATNAHMFYEQTWRSRGDIMVVGFFLVSVSNTQNGVRTALFTDRWDIPNGGVEVVRSGVITQTRIQVMAEHVRIGVPRVTRLGGAS